MKANKTWYTHTLTFGLILGLSLSILEFTALMLGVLFRPVMFNIFVFLIVITLFIAIRKYRETELNGIIKYGEVFITGLMISASAGVIWSFYRFFQYAFTPGLIEEILRLKLESISTSNFTTEQKDLYEKIAKLFTTPVILAILNTFIMSMVIGGSVLSLILGLVLKQKERPQFNNY